MKNKNKKIVVDFAAISDGYENYKTTNISKCALIDIYELRSILERAENIQKTDVGEAAKTKADRLERLIKHGKSICEKWIEGNKPLKP